MEVGYCTSSVCCGHKDIIRLKQDESWGEAIGFFFSRVELDKMRHCYYNECKNVCRHHSDKKCSACIR